MGSPGLGHTAAVRGPRSLWILTRHLDMPRPQLCGLVSLWAGPGGAPVLEGEGRLERSWRRAGLAAWCWRLLGAGGLVLLPPGKGVLTSCQLPAHAWPGRLTSLHPGLWFPSLPVGVGCDLGPSTSNPSFPTHPHPSASASQTSRCPRQVSVKRESSEMGQWVQVSMTS